MVMALTADKVLPLSALVAIVLLVAGIAVAYFVKTMAVKVIGIAISVGLALALWSQHAELKDCADRITAGIQDENRRTELTCRFFGKDIQVKLPGAPSTP